MVKNMGPKNGQYCCHEITNSIHKVYIIHLIGFLLGKKKICRSVG